MCVHIWYGIVFVRNIEGASGTKYIATLHNIPNYFSPVPHNTHNKIQLQSLSVSLSLSLSLSVQIKTARHAIKTNCVGVAAVGSTGCHILVVVGDRTI